MPGDATVPRLRLGMVGGGRGSFIGATHRLAARYDDRYELVAAALSSDAALAAAAAADLHLDPARDFTPRGNMPVTAHPDHNHCAYPKQRNQG
jgi:predicted dehydrogenase